MANRTGNYCAFYVAEPFNQNNLGANAAKDFCYYNLLKAWKAADTSFPFVDSHNKTYSVRDGSDWEQTLKPRLHERLNASANVVLFLSSETKYSRALREEIDYAINTNGLPIIVVYPEIKDKVGVHTLVGFTTKVKNLWNTLPVFRENKYKEPVLHEPNSKSQIKSALGDIDFRVATKTTADDYFYEQYEQNLGLQG